MIPIRVSKTNIEKKVKMNEKYGIARFTGMVRETSAVNTKQLM